MEKESRRRRLSKENTAVRESSRAGETLATEPTSIHDLADDLLELVLLRVTSRSSLVRAAATCRPWRRVVAADGFLRRFHSLHAPYVLGHYYAGAKTAFVPAPPPPEEATAVDVSDRVSLDFLRSSNYRMKNLVLTDCRGGLLAFVCRDVIVVCDPWTKQYREVLPYGSAMEEVHSTCLGAYLLDANESSSSGTVLHMSNFRVLCVRILHDDQDGSMTVRASVFSAKGSRWVLMSSTVVGDDVLSPFQFWLWTFRYKDCMGRVSGSLFWSIPDSNNVIQVNESTGEFSSFMLPVLAEPGFNVLTDDRRKLRVVGGDTSALRVVRIIDEDLVVFQFADGGGVCVEEKRLDLSQLCNIEAGTDQSWRFLETDETVAPGCIILSPDNKECRWMFSVHVETMEVERVQKMNWHDRRVLSYVLPWPPTIKGMPIVRSVH